MRRAINWYANLSVRYLKIFLAIAIMLNFLLAYKYIKARFFRSEADFTFNRKELFEHLNIPGNSIIFLGTSLTEQFELGELFQNTDIRNRGINGDNTVKMLNRLTPITKAHPRKIFLEAGINDIAEGTKIDTVIKHYEKLINTVQAECKTSKLYVESILPVYELGGLAVNAKIKNNDIRYVNKIIELYCTNKGIPFINLHDQFTLNGQMNPKYCIIDGVHLSGNGYLLLTKILQPYVNE